MDELSTESIIEFLRKKNLSNDIVTHSIQVSEVALAIARRILESKHNVDLRVVSAGGLLHDVGLSKASSISYDSAMNTPIRDHCALGADIARQAGFPESVVECIECHELWNGDEAAAAGFRPPIKMDYFPRTWEAKAVADADIVVTTKVAGYNPRDKDAVLKIYRPYLEKCFNDPAGRDASKIASLLNRITEFHDEMLKYIPTDPKSPRNFAEHGS